MRPSKRKPDELRRVSIERAVSVHAEGSCLIKFGNTQVLCMASLEERDYMAVPDPSTSRPRFRSAGEKAAYLTDLDRQMKQAAANLDFEKAAALRDEIKAVRVADLGLSAEPVEH